MGGVEKTMTDVKTRKRPAPLMLTPDAEARIASLMAKAPADAIGVKLSTPRRGCSGLAYSVDYVTSANPMDERIDTPGGARSEEHTSELQSLMRISDAVFC